jgi:xylose dehydrogenase (NAD/NADP)
VAVGVSRGDEAAAGVVRWGVLSTANIGRAAVNPAIQASKNGRLVAVASRDASTAKAFAEAHGIPESEGSYQALLDRDDIDAVYIPLPNSLHREWTIRAAEAGKHVLCEKPLALSAAECRDMEAAAREHGVKLMEAFMYRFHPRFRSLIELVRDGRIGQTAAVRSAFTFRLRSADNIRLDPDLGGGALMDVGCYCVNVSRTVVGEEPESAQATATWTVRGVDQRLTGVLRFPGGAVAHFDCALDVERNEVFEVAGTDGSLRVPAAFLPGTADVEIEESRGREGAARHVIAGADEYRLMVEHFADCVLHDREPRYGVAEAAANLRAIEALYRSARADGRPTEV